MKQRFVLSLLIGLLVTVVRGSPAFGAEEGHGSKKSILDLFKSTGWVGYLMVLTSIVGTVLAIQNVVEIRMDKLAPPDVTRDIEDAINEGDLDKALDVSM